MIKMTTKFIQSFIEHFPYGFCLLDSNFCYQVWNSAMKKITGIDEKDIIGKCSYEIFPFLLENGVHEMHCKALKGDVQKFDCIPFFLAQSKKYGYTKGIYIPFYDDNDLIIGIVAIIQDISTEIKLKSRINLQEEISNIFLSSFNNHNVYNLLLNKLFEYFKCNTGFFCCYENDKLICKSYSGNLSIEKIDSESISYLWKNSMINGTIDQSFGIKNYIIAPIIYDTSILGYILIGNKYNGFNTDDKIDLHVICDYISFILYSKFQIDKAVDQLKEQQLILEKLVDQRTSELKGFVQTVSHDLNGSIMAIKLPLEELMSFYIKDEPYHAIIKHVLYAVDRLKSMVNSLRDLSKVENVEKFELKKVDLNQIIDRSVILAIERYKRNKTVNIIRAPNFPMVICHSDLIEILLVNLISNSIKFTNNECDIVIDYTIDRDKKLVNVCVTDNGFGFDLEEAYDIFSPFKRLKNSINIEGSGIGLSTAYKIMKKHNQDIGFESEVGGGTTFYFTLQLCND